MPNISVEQHTYLGLVLEDHSSTGNHHLELRTVSHSMQQIIFAETSI